MRHLRSLLSSLTLLGLCWIGLSAGAPGVPYLDVANVFTANQRINAGVGINIAPGATGTLSLSSGVFERSRAAAMGDYTSVAFNAGDYTTDTGGATWTVTSGEVSTLAWRIVGHSLLVQYIITGTTIAGSPINLRFPVPGGFTAAKTMSGLCARVLDNGTPVPARGSVVAGATVIGFARTDLAAWAASTTNTTLQGAFEFEIQ